MKKSVAILGTRGYPSYYGGFETAVRHLAPHLADQGYATTVYARPGSIKLNDPAKDERVRVVMTPGVNRKSLSTLTFGLTSIVHASVRKPDVVLIMNVANCVWLPLLRIRRIPTVVNVDGIEWEREKWSTLARRVFMLGARATARWSNEIVVDSQAIGDRWREDFARDGVFIPYGGTTSEEGASPPLGLSRRKYVLLVARFVPENSVGHFFDAIQMLPPETRVILVGSSGYGGEYDDRAAKLSEDHAQVTWLGHVSDDDLLHSLWQNAGAYFHGHTVGGTNPALVQAMTLGAPTVAVDTPYNREVLDEHAIFTEPNPQAIARAISRLLADEAEQERLSKCASERAASHYTWNLVNSRYAEVLSSVSAHGSAAHLRSSAIGKRG